jgi:acyl-CoA synthetase (AMP-forming)/AMP-acid ligase II
MTALALRNLVDLVRVRAETLGEQCAYRFLADGERESAHLTYAGIDRSARALAAYIREFVAPAHPVLLAFPSGPEFIEAFFACLYAGVIAVPVGMPHPRRDNERLCAIAENCGARHVLTTAAGVRAQASSGTPSLSALRWHDSSGLTLPTGGGGGAAAVADDGIALLQYTSGSTRRPRGVKVTHANLLANLHAIRIAEGNDAHSRGLSWLPAFHDMGLIEGILQPLYGGYPAWLMPHAAFLQRPARWLEAISRYSISVSGGPNFAYELCLRRVPDESIAEIDLRSWEVAYCGAEPICARTLAAFARRFAACGLKRRALRPVYGLAEATLLVSASRRHDPQPVIVHACSDRLAEGVFSADSSAPANVSALVSCGVPAPGMKLMIVDPDTSQPLADDQVGEICVSGPSVTDGYWGDDDAKRLTGPARGAGAVRERWLRTGDLGFLTDGQLVVTGRIKDLLVVRGRKLHPQDLEQTVQCCDPRILPGRVAALAVPGPDGEAIAILIEQSRARDQQSVSSGHEQREALAAAVREQIFIRHGVALALIASVPAGSFEYTSSGKLMRYRLRDALLSGRLVLLWRDGEPSARARDAQAA